MEVTPNKNVSFEEVNNFVTVQYEGQWWLGFVLKKMKTSNEVHIRFLSPHGPSPSFTYPTRDDELVVSLQDVLSTASVELGGSGARTYKLKKEDSDKTS